MLERSVRATILNDTIYEDKQLWALLCSFLGGHILCPPRMPFIVSYYYRYSVKFILKVWSYINLVMFLNVKF